MNIVNKLTLRHMKENKRRTMVTIIGVIISVAMVTSVATLFVSFLDLMKRQEISQSGEWHVLYQNVNKEQLKAIQKDDATKEVILSRDSGYASLNGGENEYKPYLFIREYNNEGFKKIPIKLVSGRLPKAADEVVVSEHVATNGKVNLKIGDRLPLEVGNRFINEEAGLVQLDQGAPLQMENGSISETLKVKGMKTYTVTGFIKRPTWEPPWAPGYTILSYVDESLLGPHDEADVSVILKNVNRSIYNHASELAQKNGINSFDFNSTLLRYYGITNNDGLSAMLLWLSVIIIAIIVIGSVALIYNSFAISVSERSRHLGMLASVGATKRQKQNSVFFEGAVIGLISIPLGILLGIGGIGTTFWSINSIIHEALEMDEELKLIITPFSLAAACLVSILTIFISTYIPARKASKISAIDAIRQTVDVKLTGKNVKTSKLVRRIFGFNAEIGLKNLKRNKRRYKATIFSLVISIILFLSVSFFTENLKKSVVLSQGQLGYDIQVFENGQNHLANQQTFKLMAGLDGITETSEIKILNAQSLISKKDVAVEFRQKKYRQQFRHGKMPYMINMYSLKEENLKVYAKKVGVDYNKLTDPVKKTGIFIDTTSYREGKLGKYKETKVIYMKEGESLNLTRVDSEKAENLGEITIASLTDQMPMGVSTGGLGVLTVIVSENVFSQYTKGQTGMDVYSSLYLKSKDPIKTQDELDKIKSSNMVIYNNYQNRQQAEQMIKLVSVFAYGFISLITLISIANIFNTISTSISLRKREFAMLKSVGMTPKGFNKMINYESIFYGIKSLLYGLPISIGVMYLIYLAMMNSFSYGFKLPWVHITSCFAAVFLIVGAAMLYSSTKIKKENIIEALKQESI